MQNTRKARALDLLNTCKHDTEVAMHCALENVFTVEVAMDEHRRYTHLSHSTQQSARCAAKRGKPGATYRSFNPESPIWCNYQDYPCLLHRKGHCRDHTGDLPSQVEAMTIMSCFRESTTFEQSSHNASAAIHPASRASLVQSSHDSNFLGRSGTTMTFANINSFKRQRPDAMCRLYRMYEGVFGSCS
jgi:hypothetical protein